MMNFLKISLARQQKTLAFALFWAIAATLSTQAQPAPLPTNGSLGSLEPIVFAAPDLSGRGRPRGRSPGASRGRCPKRGRLQEIVALIPDTPTNPSIGLTTETHPTFWFHLPTSAQEFSRLEFILLDEEENTVYQTQLTQTDSLPGVARVRLPETLSPLTPGKTYHWFIEMRCQGTSPDPDIAPRIFIGGSAIRVEMAAELASELNAARTPRERASAYARHGIWYDALTEIGNLRSAGEARADWQQLLASLDLAHLASRSFSQCCQAPPAP